MRRYVATRVMSQIKCDGVNYRKGFIEVSTQIHDKHINIETCEALSLALGEYLIRNIQVVYK